MYGPSQEQTASGLCRGLTEWGLQQRNFKQGIAIPEEKRLGGAFLRLQEKGNLLTKGKCSGSECGGGVVRCSETCKLTSFCGEGQARLG